MIPDSRLRPLLVIPLSDVGKRIILCFDDQGYQELVCIFDNFIFDTKQFPRFSKVT